MKKGDASPNFLKHSNVTLKMKIAKKKVQYIPSLAAFKR